MTASLHADVLVIGAGPAGLHAAFYAAWRGLRVRLLEARSEPGGQLSALYPDKRVYDVPGLPATPAAQVVQALVRQLDGLDVTLHLHTSARDLRRAEHGWQVTADTPHGTQAFTAAAVVLAPGLGALRPRDARVPGEHADVRTDLPDPTTLTGRRVLVVGGVPQATRAALELVQAGAAVTLTHRRVGFRGSPAELAALEQGQAQGQLQVLAPATLNALTPGGAQLTVQGELTAVPADTVLILNGYLPDLTPLQAWPLNWQGEYIPDGPGGHTSLEGVFVAGDVAQSAQAFKLISVGLAQAAVAANHAAHHANPELRVRPGHSSEKRLS
ncbi:NAD(P)/FAD-dependent oxidoreductase [Deinococcus taeanensis]|uniref:NAD(P)/FAD-dependent oxidoreductase n=1 Tax=Deinococcus taeanensis TaxID=2737050 RepID=UPI001CDCB17D|nr:NAD(P)/FAD-dependent oxidoreductase [Deinococcus taeanensis]UBV41707.1 NAD(P)/FAD-dependent oxidoreductase [Deinococcus taeanensis]